MTTLVLADLCAPQLAYLAALPVVRPSLPVEREPSSDAPASPTPAPQAAPARPWVAGLLAVMLLVLPAREATSGMVAPAPSDPAHALLAAELQRLIPGDVRTVRFTEWLAVPVAPQTQRVLGRATLNAGGQVVPVAFRASIDQASGDVMHLSYRMLDVSPRAAMATAVPDGVLRNRIGGEFVARFPAQPMDFRIVAITRQVRLGSHLMVEGEGVTDFFDEGQVRTPFVATFAMPSAQLVRLDYELMAEPEGANWVADSR